MKRFLAFLTALLTAVFLLGACGRQPVPEKVPSSADTAPKQSAADLMTGEDHIRLLVWCADSAVDVTKELCDTFIKSHPEKDITIEVQVQGEDTAASRVLSSPGEAADVFSFPSDQLDSLYQANALAPVSDPDAITARNTSSSIAAGCVGTELFAFPETADNGCYLVYDKSVVSDEDAKTLEGVLEACRKAGKKFVMDAGNGFFACLFPFTGGLAPEGIRDGVQQFNPYSEEQVVTTLCAFSALFDRYSDVFLSAEAERISSGMASEPSAVAAGIDGSWNANAVRQALGGNFGAAKLPTVSVGGVNRQIYSLHGYKFIGVHAQSRFPRAAQALADYLTGEDAQLKRAQELGWGPSNLKAAVSPAVTGNPALTALLAQTEFSVPQTQLSPTFWTPMGSLGDYLWKTKADRNAVQKEFDKTIAAIQSK